MKTVERQKICSNCDGRIPQDAVQCPYCFTPQQNSLDNSSSKSYGAPVQENFLYSPPYSTPKPPETSYSKTPEAQEAALKVSEPASFWPILLLTVGGNLFTLGILQFLFSDHGVVHLEINGSYWFLMVLVSLPLFYFGLKNINTTKPTN